MELTPVPSCSVTSTQAQITVQVDDEAEISQPTRSWSTRRALLWLTLVILVATCCNALIPVIYGGPVNQAKHETASEFQSLLSKDWPSMDVKQDLESGSFREGLLMPSNQAVRHRVASETPTKHAHRKSRKLPRRIKKNRHESTTPSTSTLSAAFGFTLPTSMTSPTTPALLPTISSTTAMTTTTTTSTSTTPTISFEATTSSTTTTTTRPPQRNSPTSGHARTPRRNRPNHSKRNSIKLRSKCFPGFVTIGATEVVSRDFDKNAESEAFLQIISLNSTNKNKTIVALRGEKSGNYLCLEKEKGFVSRKLRPNSIPRECQFIEKHLNGKYVRFVSYRGPRRFLSFDENGRAVPWRNHKKHKMHSKRCTNFLRVAPAESNEKRKIVRQHLLPNP